MFIKISNEHVLKISFNLTLMRELIRSYKNFKEDFKEFVDQEY